jgi:hypothetical protein
MHRSAIKWTATLLAAVAAYAGVTYLFAIPSGFLCEAKIPKELSNATLLENPIDDAISVRIWKSEFPFADFSLQVCYPAEQPQKVK